MGNANVSVKMNDEMGASQLRLSHYKVFQTGFGDISLQLWKDEGGNPYIRMERGKPQAKTFCLEHFLLFADKVQEIADKVREKTGEL